MKTSRVSTIALLAPAVIIVAGCAPALRDPTTGAIVPRSSSLDVGSRAPDATFLDHRGKRRNLSRLFEDATLIAFVKGVCAKPNAQVVAVADRLHDGTAVVEVCTGQCDSHSQCLETHRDKTGNIIRLCDAQGALSRRYGVLDGEPLFVIDEFGTIAAIGDLASLKKLRRKTQEVAEEAQKRHEEHFQH